MSYASIVLVVTMAVFAAVVWWAYAPRFKKRHEKDGMIPFLDSAIPRSAAAESETTDKTTS
jgi:cytochrome c oxidase cbb3-type subunit 4